MRGTDYLGTFNGNEENLLLLGLNTKFDMSYHEYDSSDLAELD